MKFEDAIEYLIKDVGASYFSFDRKEHKIKKNTSFISSSVEHAQQLKIIEKFEELGIKYQLELNGEIQVL